MVRRGIYPHYKALLDSCKRFAGAGKNNRLTWAAFIAGFVTLARKLGPTVYREIRKITYPLGQISERFSSNYALEGSWLIDGTYKKRNRRLWKRVVDIFP